MFRSSRKRHKRPETVDAAKVPAPEHDESAADDEGPRPAREVAQAQPDSAARPHEGVPNEEDEEITVARASEAAAATRSPGEVLPGAVEEPDPADGERTRVGVSQAPAEAPASPEPAEAPARPEAADAGSGLSDTGSAEELAAEEGSELRTSAKEPEGLPADVVTPARETAEAAAFFNLAVVLHQRGYYTEAMSAYQRAEETGDPDAAFNLGVLHYGAGDHDAAEAAWRRCIARKHPKAATNLGFLLESRGDLEGARAMYQHAAQWGDEAGARRLDALSIPQESGGSQGTPRTIDPSRAGS